MASRTNNACSLFLLGALLMGGCAYQSFYKETNHDLKPAAVAAKNVKVYKQKDDITSEYVELGLFRGSAPTVTEAMDTAKQTCGQAGGSFYILNTPPFRSGNSYRVDGICAAPATATSAATSTSGGKTIQ